MTDTFQLELVSPERSVMSRPVPAVILPGADGQMTVLPDHAPVITALRPGLLEVFDTQGQSPDRIFLKGGVAEIRRDRLVVLAEDTIDPSTAKSDQLLKEIAKLEGAREQAVTEFDRKRAEKEIAWRAVLTDFAQG